MSESQASQEMEEEAPSDIIERQFVVQAPRCWRINDVQATINMWIEIAGAKRPTIHEDDVVEIIEAAKAPTKKRKRTEEEGGLNAGDSHKLTEIHSLIRRHYIRYFHIESYDVFINQVYTGLNLKKHRPAAYDTIRNRASGGVYQIKHQTLERAELHVEELLEKASRAIKTSQDIPTLNEFFGSHYNTENLLGIFTWIEPIVDVDKSANRAKSFLYTTYVNLCTFIKFMLDTPQLPEYNRESLILFWDRLGQSENWNHVEVSHFAIRPPKIKKRKSKRGDARNFVQIDADHRYTAPETPFDESGDKDCVLETPTSSPITTRTPARNQSESLGGIPIARTTARSQSESLGGIPIARTTARNQSESLGGTPIARTTARNQSESLGGTPIARIQARNQSESLGGTPIAPLEPISPESPILRHNGEPLRGFTSARSLHRIYPGSLSNTEALIPSRAGGGVPQRVGASGDALQRRGGGAVQLGGAPRGALQRGGASRGALQRGGTLQRGGASRGALQRGGASRGALQRGGAVIPLRASSRRSTRDFVAEVEAGAFENEAEEEAMDVEDKDEDGDDYSYLI